jgi:hypothetical protein
VARTTVATPAGVSAVASDEYGVRCPEQIADAWAAMTIDTPTVQVRQPIDSGSGRVRARFACACHRRTGGQIALVEQQDPPRLPWLRRSLLPRRAAPRCRRSNGSGCGTSGQPRTNALKSMGPKVRRFA